MMAGLGGLRKETREEVELTGGDQDLLVLGRLVLFVFFVAGAAAAVLAEEVRPATRYWVS